MIDEKELVKKCLTNDSGAQELLYRRYASKMLGVCLRYSKNRMEAEDILQEGYIKVFKNLSSYKFDGSFEGWVRRIMVNTSIEFYRNNARMFPVPELDKAPESAVEENQLSSRWAE